jgi:hypothetical protein
VFAEWFAVEFQFGMRIDVDAVVMGTDCKEVSFRAELQV